MHAAVNFKLLNRHGLRLLARPRRVLFAVILVLCTLISGNWKVDQDSVGYLLMARSLAQGHGLHRFGLHEWYYAPGYSVLISPAFWSGGNPFWAISIINVITARALVIGAWVWFLPYSRRGAVLVAALVGLNCGMWDVCREPRADTLFSALLIWAAVLLAGALNAVTIRRLTMFTVTGAAILGAACLTRQVGIFLAAGFLAVTLAGYFRERLRVAHVAAALFVSLAAVVAVGSLSLHDHLSAKLDRAGLTLSYWNQFRQPGVALGEQLLDGIRRQTADVGRLCIPGMWGSFAHQGQWLNINTIVYALFIIPVTYGWWRLARRSRDPLLWTVPFYALMFTFWPFDQGTRFNVPMLPVLAASVWSMLQRFPRQRPTILLAALLAHLAADAVYLVHDVRIVRYENRDLPALISLSSKITTADPVAVTGVPWHVQWMECYLLDRPVQNLPSERISAIISIRWSITGIKSQPPAGFEVIGTSGGFALGRRVFAGAMAGR
jgi:hypothetical protein